MNEKNERMMKDAKFCHSFCPACPLLAGKLHFQFPLNAIQITTPLLICKYAVIRVQLFLVIRNIKCKGANGNYQILSKGHFLRKLKKIQLLLKKEKFNPHLLFISIYFFSRWNGRQSAIRERDTKAVLTESPSLCTQKGFLLFGYAWLKSVHFLL